MIHYDTVHDVSHVIDTIMLSRASDQFHVRSVSKLLANTVKLSAIKWS